MLSPKQKILCYVIALLLVFIPVQAAFSACLDMHQESSHAMDLEHSAHVDSEDKNLSHCLNDCHCTAVSSHCHQVFVGQLGNLVQIDPVSIRQPLVHSSPEILSGYLLAIFRPPRV